MFFFQNYIYIRIQDNITTIINANNIYYYCLNKNKNNKFMLFPIGKNVVFNYNQTGLVVFYVNKIYLKSIFDNVINNVIYCWVYYVLRKLKFRFKGSWIYIKRKKINGAVLDFGRNHRVLMILLGCYMIRKKNLLKACLFSIFGVNSFEVAESAATMCLVRPFSTYNLRGVRVSRQKFYKRVGKISKYTMFKSKIF